SCRDYYMRMMLTFREDSIIFFFTRNHFLYDNSLRSTHPKTNKPQNSSKTRQTEMLETDLDTISNG
ncbi:MAG TPA: hypothetical protein PLY34_17820, partial [Ferruginibacter sp.]|nr:hypothetical protein [Ferruginibacter sp.]